MVADTNDDVLAYAIMRLSGNILGLVLGILLSVGIFLATNFLLIKGGSVVGPHLSLLGQYFIGYTVSFTGSLIGSLYAFVIGYLSGVLIAWIYNGVAAHRWTTRRDRRHGVIRDS
jgi:hypothetical protein